MAPSAPTSLDRALPAMLLVLTAVTGIVDAISYLALGRVFTANMTGNVVFVGFAMAGAEDLSIPRSLVALLAFLSGAIIGGRMIVQMSSLSRKRWISTAFFAEAALLLVAAASAWDFSAESAGDNLRTYTIIILTAVTMGLRNATVRKLAVPDLTTTVLTLTVTGIGADSSAHTSSRTAWIRRSGSVLLMFAGAAVGALLLRGSVALPLAVASIAAAACAVTAVLLPEDSPPVRT